MLEKQCRMILEQTRYNELQESEIERIYTLFSHDIAMAAQSGGQLAFDLIEEDSALIGDEGYTLWGRLEKCLSMEHAVQYNAMAVTASIREDFVAGTHPGAILFPVLYAESERYSYETQELVSAAAIGLKLAGLLNVQLGKYLTARGYRPTTVVGSMAAAGALTWLRTKSEERALEAMSVAAATANGFAFPFQEGTEEWLLQVPLSAQAAIAACRNIRSLSFHHQQFLTGDYSLGKLIDYEEDHSVTWEEAADINQIGVKRHPVNSYVQPVVEALLRITAQQDIMPESVQSVTITVPASFSRMEPNLTRSGLYDRPNLSLFSIPISGAIAIIHRRLQFADLKHANDSDVQQLAVKCSVVYSSELSNYDVKAAIQTETGLASSFVSTSFFYPTFETELQWIREQHGEALIWVEQFLREWGSTNHA